MPEALQLTKAALATHLDGKEYPFDVPPDLEAQAKDAGLVVVFGASDDLMELRGAISEEVGAGEGATILLTQDGLFVEDACESHCRYFQQAKADAERHGATITALWEQDGVSWSYETSIPHATFTILQDGEVYCRGMVFALADVGKTE